MSAILRADPSGLPIDRSRSGGATANASRRLEKVIKRCLEKEPDRRFNEHARRENRASCGRARRGGNKRCAARDDGLPSRSWRSSRSAWRSGLVCAPDPAPLPPPAAMKVVQLTSLNGLEIAPTFSPDGTQVAFSWNGEREDNYDIYVKTVGSSDVRRLTTDPAADTLPIWSPDGEQIAFLHDHPGGGTIVHSVLPYRWRGAEADRLPHRRGVSARIAWSPDERWIVGRPDLTEDLAKRGSWALYLIPLGSGTPRRLTEQRRPTWTLPRRSLPTGAASRMPHASTCPVASAA